MSDAEEYLAKAERALAAARRAIEDKDAETAANRVYYAMPRNFGTKATTNSRHSTWMMSPIASRTPRR